MCVDAACQIAGYDDLVASVRASGGHVHLGPCLGQCERAPALFVQGAGGRPDYVPADAEPFELPQAGDPSLRLLRRIGVADPESLESYMAHGGYEALRRAGEMGAEAVMDAVADSGLSGRGGAAFPTGVKWRAVAGETGRPKHVVANCDESEPGTFKDRIVMEHDPFAVIEAMTIAGFATGANNGWIYIRGEYPQATARLQGAIDAARAAGLLGPDAAGTGHDFDIAIWRGAGAYICGEETALFNSLEGFRGEPRNKPTVPYHPRPVRRANRHQQPRDADQRARHPHRRSRGVPGQGAPSDRPAPGSSACRDTSATLASTRCRSEPRWERCWSSPAGSRAPASSRRC